MKLVKFTLTDSNGPVYVNPRRVVSVKAARDSGTACVTMRDGWLMHVRGDAAAVAQALESVKLLPDAQGPDTVLLTRVATGADTDMPPPDRPWPAVTYTTLEVAVSDVLCVTRVEPSMGTESVLYLAGLPGAPLGLAAPLELAEPPDVVAAKLEGRQ